MHEASHATEDLSEGLTDAGAFESIDRCWCSRIHWQMLVYCIDRCWCIALTDAGVLHSQMLVYCIHRCWCAQMHLNMSGGVADLQTFLYDKYQNKTHYCIY